MLPFLKKTKLPKLPKDMEDKSIGFSPDEMLHEKATRELQEAIHNKDPKAFRSSLEAIILNLFKHGDPEHAA